MTDYTTRGTLLHRSLGCAPADKSIRADVEFGVMQSNGDCIGIGICRITTTHYAQQGQKRPRQRSCPLVSARIQARSDGRLVIFFPKSGMLPCTERAFFRQPVFPVSVPYYLPDDLREQLPELRLCIVEPGVYPIQHSASGYWVTF